MIVIYVLAFQVSLLTEKESVKRISNLIRSRLGSLSYEEEFTVCFVKEPNSSEESALSFRLSRRLTNTNAAFTIINGLTISFVSDANDNTILMYSHLHLPKGAFLAVSTQ